MESHSSDNNISIWMTLALLLIVAGLVAMGSMALLSWNQQNEQPTGSQTAPRR
jgi:hypothetical protein